MTFEIAVIPKEARIAALERSLAEKIDASRELRHQKAGYLSQLTEANRCISDLEIKLTSAQSSLQEKDSVIHMMQKSFLEPEEDPLTHALPPSSLHQLPPPLPPHHAPPHHHSGNHYQPPPPLPPHHLPPHFPTSETPGGPEHDTTPPHGNRGSLGSYIEVVPYPPQQSSHWAISSSNPPRSPNAPIASPAVRRNNYRSQSVSPIKALGGCVNISSKPRSAPASNYVQEGGVASSTSRKNGYSAPTSRYVPHSLHHCGNCSSSAPNSPNVKSSPRKARISHPNMRLLQVPATDYSGGFRQNQPHNNIRWKSNTGPGGIRRANYKPLPSPRAVKSKTPPPDYRLVSVSGGRGGGKQEPPKMLPKKQRHRSVEDMLDRSAFGDGCGQHQDTPPTYPPSSLELFQSLVGQNGGVHNTPGGLVSSLQMGGARGVVSDHYGVHQHSKSSPPNDKVSLKYL